MPNCVDFPFTTPADFQVSPYPSGSLECGQTGSLTAWMGWLNQTFQLVACAMQKFLNIEVELPGVAEVIIPEIPGYAMPGMEGYSVDRRGRGFPGWRNRTGNVWPITLGHQGKPFHLRVPHFADIPVGATPGLSLPGIDPYSVIFTQINLNFETIQELLAEQSIVYEFEPIPITGNVCLGSGSPAGGSSADPTQLQQAGEITNENFQELADAIKSGGEPCVFGAFQPFSNFQNPGPVAAGGTAWDFSNAGTVTVPAPSGSPPSFRFAINSNIGDVNNFIAPASTKFYLTTRQPLICGHGFTLGFDGILIVSYSAAQVDTIEFFVDVGYLLPDNTFTLLQSKHYTRTGGHGSNFTVTSGADSVVVLPGVVPVDGTLGVDMYFTATGPVTSSSFSIRGFTLTDNGP